MAFENRLLEKTFEGVLRGSPVRLRSDLISKETIDEAIAHLPLSLSPNQHQAIRMSWQNEITYIQGPPGTGKSHTIRAIMLTALLLDKRVLLVSQKKAAIDVVRDELNILLGEHAVVYIGNDGKTRKSLKEFLQDRLKGAKFQLTRHLPEIELEIKTLRESLKRNRAKLESLLECEGRFFEVNESLVRARSAFQKNYEYKPNMSRVPGHFEDRAAANLQRLRIYEDKDNPSIKEKLFYARSRKVYKDILSANRELADKFGSTYLHELLNVDVAFTRSESSRQELDTRRKATDSIALRRFIETDEERLQTALKIYLRGLRDRKLNYAINTSVEDNDGKDAVSRFAGLLHWTSPKKITDVMANIDYNQVTGGLPLWAGEIKDLGNYLPFTSDIFDMVIVDEASQVNIAEIIPAFYRGTRFCIVGDKQQLGLNAAGLFRLNKTFEQLTWEQYVAGSLPYSQAKVVGLTVSESSILDFITSGNGFVVPSIMLDEHYRSMPQLAKFTSEQFYQGKLRIMTETPSNIKLECFDPIKVKGERDQKKKVVPAEVDQLIELLKRILNHSYRDDPLLSKFGFSDPPSVGIISFLTNQRNYIEDRIEEEFDADEIKRIDIHVGTPEEFQGHERDIIFLTLGLDGTSHWGKGHYENPNRFNVATSRARKFTYLIYGGLPSNADLLKQYTSYFRVRVIPEDFVEPPLETDSVFRTFSRWRFRDNGLQSEFEREVYSWLRKFVEVKLPLIEIYNQVPSCNKYLDFVLYNPSNDKSVAIEVDGKHHFGPDGLLDADDIERERVLKRAGWKILRIPYYDWYQNGWLCREDNDEFLTRWQLFCDQLRANLS